MDVNICTQPKAHEPEGLPATPHISKFWVQRCFFLVKKAQTAKDILSSQKIFSLLKRYSLFSAQKLSLTIHKYLIASKY